MDFSEVIGQKHIKAHLTKTIEHGRIPHAQLFVGTTGSGILPMAVAYARQLLCSNYDEGSKEQAQCGARVDKLVHPDLHFVYPVNKVEKSDKHPVSSDYVDEWRKFFFSNPYGSLFDWLQWLGIENKQGNISVHEAHDMLKTLSLKSYEAGYKIIIVWMAENMPAPTSNKILKIIEEPPEKTVLLLLTENEEQLLGTIRSRCQKLDFPKLSEKDITTKLLDCHDVTSIMAKRASSRANGDLNKALHLVYQEGDDIFFEQWFVSWVRAAFMAKGNKKAINELLAWSDRLAAEGRETQKQFLSFCIELFRQALLKNYKAESLLYFESDDGNFSLDKFAPFIHQNNIYEIIEALENATYHIERNGNSKIILTDLSIQLTRLIHKKELA